MAGEIERDFREIEKRTLTRMRETLEGTAAPREEDQLVDRGDDDEMPFRCMGVICPNTGDEQAVISYWEEMRLLGVKSIMREGDLPCSDRVADEIHEFGAEEIRIATSGFGPELMDSLWEDSLLETDDIDFTAVLREDYYRHFNDFFREDHLPLTDDPCLLEELGGVRYTLDREGSMRIESREETAQRLGRDPTLAEAAVLGFPGVNPDGSLYEAPTEMASAAPA